jgi:hypothetical protein
VGQLPELNVLFWSLVSFAVLATLWFIIILVVSLSEVLNVGIWRTLMISAFALPVSAILASVLVVPFRLIS